EILQLLEQARVPGGPIYNVQDMFADPHFNARGMFEQVEINGKPLKIPAILPKLSDTPGHTDWPGGDIGSHTQEILQSVLNLSQVQIDELKTKGVI
ncbi:MAG TPA: CoA transferase, partial [Cellvibrio sp.]